MLDKQPRDRRIAVGKVERVGAAGIGISSGRIAHARNAALIELQTAKTGKAHRPAVKRGDGIDSDTPPALRSWLKIGERGRIGVRQIREIGAVTHPRQPVLLLSHGQAGKIVGATLLDSGDIASGGRAQRRSGKHLEPGSLASAGRQIVRAEGRLVEEDSAAEASGRIKVLGLDPLHRRHIDADLLEQPVGLGAIGARAVDLESTAVANQHRGAGSEFIALGMAAQVVVVFQDQDTRRGLGGAKKMRCGESADPAADHDQVVMFAGIGRYADTRIAAIAENMRSLEGTRMGATQASPERGIAIRSIPDS